MALLRGKTGPLLRLLEPCWQIYFSLFHFGLSKAFRVFNSRTRIVQETLHVNFIENKPNVAGSGPTWLFDIDILTRTMNYHPVNAENQTNSHACLQDTEKVGEEVTHTYEHDDDIQKSVSPDIHSSSSGAQTRKQGDKTENKDKGKSPVVTITGFKDLNSEFEECTNNSSNGVNVVGSLVSTVGHNFINSTNNFSVAGPSNTAGSPTVANSSSQEACTSSHDSDMPNLEDLTHFDDADDVGAEADINNLESIISEEGIDYEEVFSLVARIEAIRLLLAYASFMGFLVYQMDVKSAFLYGTIEEEVYVCRPPGFEDPENLDKVYKVVKALYGLHQAPRAWSSGKSASTPIDAEKPLLNDSDGEDVDVHTYRDDCAGHHGISALMKCTSAIRQLAYGCVPDSLDEYLQMGATTARKCLENFCKVIMNLYGEEFLRKPTYTDIEKLYAYHNEKHGFPGMLGSIDCTN
nr:putative harbinger transposase-derived protein [Tanacetum cinerariifolium]